jgi:hypothetical protein
MAASGFTPISLYYSSTAAAAPTSVNLVDGELAINITDGKLYYKDNTGTVKLLASSSGAAGDVVGPASATDNAIARFDGTTGKLIQNSAVTIADTTGNMTGVGTLSSGAITTTGVLTVPAGTVSLPAITTTGDTNTGIFFPAADTIAFTDGGVESLRITSTGGVSFGTTGTAYGTSGQVLTSQGNATPTWTTPTTGTVTSVTGTSPVVSSGGATPAISMPAATTSVSGYLTSTDWTTFNNKASTTAATSTVAGLIELGSDTVQTVASSAVSATASRSYALQVNASGQGVINVPWTDTNSGGTVTSVATSGSVNGLTLTGGTITTTGTITLGGSITSVSTSGNFQMNSLGVGTAGSATAGEIRATNNITAYYSSDRKLKENIQDVDNALDKVCSIGSKTFDWTDEYIAAHGGEDGYFVTKSDFGVVAQDVQSVFPQAVRTREDGTLAVDYEKLSTLAFGAIKELVKRIEALEAK